MEKWRKWYVIITTSIFVIILFLACVLLYDYNSFSVDNIEFIKFILRFLFLFITIAMVGYFLLGGIFAMKRGIHNIKKCDDELFKNIDQYKRCWKEDNHYYIKQVQIINLYYKEGGKVDELVNNNEIERLYARADFLFIQNSFFDNFTTCFYSLIISIIASYVCEMVECGNLFFTFMWMIVILLSFFGIALSRYIERGQAGSYRYYIDEYERALLLEKIRKLEKNIEITDDDESILETKQVVLNELLLIRKKTKQKKQPANKKSRLN